MSLNKCEAVRSFAQTRRRTSPRVSRDAFEHWQQKKLAEWLKHDVPKVGFYEQGPQRLTDLPVVDKEIVQANFNAFNRKTLGRDQVETIISNGGREGSITAGKSSGTSGNAGLFVISERERYRWLGTILAKALPDLITRRLKIAIILPRGTGLYDSANSFRRIDIRFFDPATPQTDWLEAINDFGPSVVVSTPKVLRVLAERLPGLSPLRVFSGSETLDPVDREVIEQIWRLRLDQIYMASEGLFAVTCRHGQLHLAEESTFFEFEEVPGGLVNPIISTFQRSLQIVLRYRMNDLLRLSDRPCDCGSPLRIVEQVIGRTDDLFWFQTSSGPVLVAPDVMRNRLLEVSDQIDDFRIIQDQAQSVTLRLSNQLPAAIATDAQAALQRLFDEKLVDVKVALVQEPLGFDHEQKLRRIRSLVKKADL